jgi:hypothetical protein
MRTGAVRYVRRRVRHEQRCVNRRCREFLPPFTRVRLCPSCRLAGTYGAMLAGGISAAIAIGRLVLQHWP